MKCFNRSLSYFVLATLASMGGGCTGADGTPCSVAANQDGTSTISCPDGTKVNVSSGKDGNNGNNGTSCSVKDNGDGTETITCSDGTSVVVKNGDAGTPGPTGEAGAPGEAGLTGETGAQGNPGPTGGNVQVANFHGTDRIASDAYEAAGIYFPAASITGATADATGLVTVNFKVLDAAGKPVLGLGTGVINGKPVTGIGAGVVGVSANIAKLVPSGTGADVFSKWVPYIQTLETVSGSASQPAATAWPNPDGTKAAQGASESAGTGATNGTLTDNGDGTYKYVFKNNISALKTPDTMTAITYERNRTHRVSIMFGGHFGPTGTATFDFVPDGSALTEKRDIIDTATCKQCHGTYFKAHGGNRLTVENCVTCHAPGSADANSGNSIDFKQMIHKIHAGAELASGKPYAIWGYQNAKLTWPEVMFPALLSNCQKCHQGTGSKVDNWKNVPSRDACGSCHDNVDFKNGIVNPPSVLGWANCTADTDCTGPYGYLSTCDTASKSCVLAQHPTAVDDSTCSACHTGTAAKEVSKVHDWTKGDSRLQPEYSAAVTVTNLPAKGYFDVGDPAPIIKIALTDVELATPAVIDHSTFKEDPTPEGCLKKACPPKDGLFTGATFYFAGPRAHRSPVLTSNARTTVLSAAVGPWDLTALIAAKGTLELVVDGNLDVYAPLTINATDAGRARISVPFTTFAPANKAAVTVDEIVTWLNANPNFQGRAIAEKDPVTLKLSVRSRNLGNTFSMQLLASKVTTTVFGVAQVGGVDVDGALKFVGSGANDLRQRTTAANDPKVTWKTDGIYYQLDPVDDLEPGTYVASIQIADRGSVSGQAENYKRQTIAVATVNVKTKTEEKPIANNCSTCHSQSPSDSFTTYKGFVDDPIRHAKTFAYQGVDQCGACHDYQSSALVPTRAGEWPGGGGWPISQRVHSLHFGSKLNTPVLTVGHEDPEATRFWDIEFPNMDLVNKSGMRNCETCHDKTATSGSWLTNPGRLACSGCHDSLPAQAHIKAQTYDPTPAWPYSGDERESCTTCH